MTKKQIRNEAKKQITYLTFETTDIAFQAGWELGVQSVLHHLASLPSATVRQELEEYIKG